MQGRRRLSVSLIASLCLISAGLAAGAQKTPPAHGPIVDPWTAAQVISPADVAAKLSHEHMERARASWVGRAVILQVGFSVLYRSKHIPGAIYAGPASTAAGLAKLHAAVNGLSKEALIYIYCGCCPMNKCPNIRPAFLALQLLGFSNVHVLVMPDNFGKDWVARGYPVAGETAHPH